jgi:TonB-dependent receptor
MGLLKNFVSISQGLPGNNPGDPGWIIGANGQPTGVTPRYTASAYNPYLKPTQAWQFDLSLENYFANVGSFSFALFHKRFKDYIQYGLFNQTVTRDGVTRNVEVNGPANGKGAKISGMEIAYTRFFDFLPDPLNGLGIQTNFTYVKDKGIPNSNLSIVGNTGSTTGGATSGTSLNPGALEGLSKYAYNIVGMYEKNGLNLRLAYNWRSKYLVTAVDCCVALPVWQKAAGYLDGTIRYAVNPHVEVQLQASNLLNTKTVLMQQVTDENSKEGKALLFPNAWFQNDRRFTIGARLKFGK